MKTFLIHLTLAVFCLCASSAPAGIITFTGANRTMNNVTLRYTADSAGSSTFLEPGFETVLAVEGNRRPLFTALETTTHHFDLSIFTQDSFSDLCFVVVSDDRIEVFDDHGFTELETGGFTFADPSYPAMILNGRKKTAEPGATDNPDGAQRLREDH